MSGADTTHDRGLCVPILKKHKDHYQVWIEGVDAVITGFFLAADMLPVLQRFQRLSPEAKGQGKEGVFLYQGVTVKVTDERSKYVRVLLPQVAVPPDPLPDRGCKTLHSFCVSSLSLASGRSSMTWLIVKLRIFLLHNLSTDH